MSYNNISIKKAINAIKKNDYLLPAIQRELVWKPEQIEKLFDSLLSGYPFGSMLFWLYERPAGDTYKFYEFIKYYDQSQENRNKEYSVSGDTDIVGILDGQQRLTAFYLGLCSYLNLHIPYRDWKKTENFEKKFLYLNLLYIKSKTEDEDIANEYEFKFKTSDEVEKENIANPEKYLWFKVGNVLDYKEKLDYKKQITNYSSFSEEKKNIIDRVMDKLYSSIVTEDRINYYEENSDSLEKILNIFIRINSGGTTLDYTDFLMSMIINQWGEGRDEINKKLDDINKSNNFSIPKDTFLRGCLYLIGAPLAFTVDNFKQKNIAKIHKDFSEIAKYIKASCKIFNTLGYNKDNLKSNLIVIPLAQFLMQNRKETIDGINLVNVKKWIMLSILSRVFGGSTTTYLTKLRDIIKETTIFPINEIIKESGLIRKSMEITQEQLEELVDNARYGSQDAWALLTLLYPSYNYENITYNEDHIFPKFKMTPEQYKNGGNFIANLQLLDHTENCEEKRAEDPEVWLEDYCKRKQIGKDKYKVDNFIPLEYSMTWDKFDDFINDRKKNILERLASELGIKKKENVSDV